MSELLKGRRLIFYDFEVLSKLVVPETGMKYWFVIFVDYETRKIKLIKNNVEELKEFYNSTRDDVFIGYNSRGYDQYIFKGLMLGMDAGYITEQLITYSKKGYQVVPNAWTYPLNNFDTIQLNKGLKQLEAYMGSEIKEADIPWDIDRPLSEEEEKELMRYCLHDNKENIKLFEKTKNTFTAYLNLIEMFDLPFNKISRTGAQLTADILEAKKLEGLDDDFEFIYPDTLKLEKYTEVLDFFKSVGNGTFVPTKFEKGKPKIEVELEISGVPTKYALGGLHGAIPNLIYEGKIYSLDVTSLYPSLILEYGLMSRACESDEKFRYVRTERVRLKKEGNPLQESLKLILNTTYGTFGDQYNNLCDKRMMYSVCVHGQLLLTDFMEKIEPYCTLFNLNTDGVFFYIDEDNHDDNFKKIMEAKEEWENRTRLGLELEEYKKIIQKDVNNYIVVPEGDLYYPSGKPRYKAKGAYVKELNEIDYDLPIVNEAIKNYFLKNIAVEDTINNCTSLHKFQKIVKLTSAYQYAMKDCTFSEKKVLNELTGKMNKKTTWDDNGDILKDKTFRVFASTNDNDGGLFKRKEGKNPEKFANTPDKCFIDNDDVTDKITPDKLDRQFYIDLAQKRVNQYLGISNRKKKQVKEDKVS
ncbi:hypothetical protein [Lysinibacillus sphaericus]|uniref:hypothetical protein n=1 Tax=Lysinibacillus sphaericus TaxID=1421 RepID=UPI0018CCEA12|nr:hypothetical protein [Lysinibacillus sphaericus]